MARMDWERATARDRVNHEYAVTLAVRATSAHLPATDKQTSFLRRLGAQVPAGLNRAQASDLIKTYKRNCA